MSRRGCGGRNAPDASSCGIRDTAPAQLPLAYAPESVWSTASTVARAPPRRSRRNRGRGSRYPAELDRPDLDAPTEVLVQLGRRVLRRDLDRLVEVARLDQEVAAELLLGLGERPVGHEDLAAARAQAHGVLGGRERADLEQLAGTLQLGVVRAALLFDRGHVGRREGLEFLLVVVGQAQVLHWDPPAPRRSGTAQIDSRRRWRRHRRLPACQLVPGDARAQRWPVLQVSVIGRFWVSTEGEVAVPLPPRAPSPSCSEPVPCCFTQLAQHVLRHPVRSGFNGSKRLTPPG